jgi:hypothetical protein
MPRRALHSSLTYLADFLQVHINVKVHLKYFSGACGIRFLGVKI